MPWRKRGLIYRPDGSIKWSQTHAQAPAPLKINDTTIRVFFSTRNKQGLTQTGYVDLDIDNPKIIKNICKEPFIRLGKPGMHNDRGSMFGSIVVEKEEIKIYFTGWHVPITVDYECTIGLATTKNLDKIDYIFKGPLIYKNIYEPYWVGAPCVIKEKEQYKMWYISTFDNVEYNGKLEPVYHIKYATSLDGIDWKQSNEPIIKCDYDGEALGRPWVINEEGKYKMWFSKRGTKDYRSSSGEHYNMAYAESENGIDWIRKDNEVGISTSENGWDSEMIEYGSVYHDERRKYMFYNGNGFGREGFGYAEYI